MSTVPITIDPGEAGATLAEQRRASTASRHSSAHPDYMTPVYIVEAARVTLGEVDLDPATSKLANELVRADEIFGGILDGMSFDWNVQNEDGSWKPSRVFLNPPGGRSDNLQRPVHIRCESSGSCGLPVPHVHEGVEASAKKWWFKLTREFVVGHVEAAIFVGFSVEILQSTQVRVPKCPTGYGCPAEGNLLPIPLDFPLCFPRARVAYDREVDGMRKKAASPPHASVIVCVARSGSTYVRRFLEAFSEIGRVVNIE